MEPFPRFLEIRALPDMFPPRFSIFIPKKWVTLPNIASCLCAWCALHPKCPPPGGVFLIYQSLDPIIKPQWTFLSQRLLPPLHSLKLTSYGLLAYLKIWLPAKIYLKSPNQHSWHFHSHSGHVQSNANFDLPGEHFLSWGRTSFSSQTTNKCPSHGLLSAMLSALCAFCWRFHRLKCR